MILFESGLSNSSKEKKTYYGDFYILGQIIEPLILWKTFMRKSVKTGR